MADLVTLTLQSSDGEKRDYSFAVDDYHERSADGGVESYLRERAFPKVAARWMPDFTEVDRRVVYGLDPDDPASMDTARKALGVVHVGKAHALAGVG